VFVNKNWMESAAPPPEVISVQPTDRSPRLVCSLQSGKLTTCATPQSDVFGLPRTRVFALSLLSSTESLVSTSRVRRVRWSHSWYSRSCAARLSAVFVVPPIITSRRIQASPMGSVELNPGIPSNRAHSSTHLTYRWMAAVGVVCGEVRSTNPLTSPSASVDAARLSRATCSTRHRIVVPGAGSSVLRRDNRRERQTGRL
jgi:hypothetical protein